MVSQRVATATNPHCAVNHLLLGLKAGERRALNRMMADPAWSYPQIHRAIRAEGYEFPQKFPMIGRHVRNECDCNEGPLR